MENKKEGTNLENVFMAEADQKGIDDIVSSNNPMDKALKDAEKGLANAMGENNMEAVYGTREEYLAPQSKDSKLEELKRQTNIFREIRVLVSCSVFVLIVSTIFIAIKIVEIIDLLKP